mmetsp:Transcript_13459/g.34524  ORF Transcript_13459/g.34524 Transcript_13459/m.34524 type:complete len:211 (+) Transcript_13459:394-1026(+)
MRHGLGSSVQHAREVNLEPLLGEPLVGLILLVICDRHCRPYFCDASDVRNGVNDRDDCRNRDRPLSHCLANLLHKEHPPRRRVCCGILELRLWGLGEKGHELLGKLFRDAFKVRQLDHGQQCLFDEQGLWHVRGYSDNVEPELPSELEAVVVQEMSNPLRKHRRALHVHGIQSVEYVVHAQRECVGKRRGCPHKLRKQGVVEGYWSAAFG